MGMVPRFVRQGHRRLLEHLADPACPSIRGFVQSFGNEPSLTVSGNGKDDVDKRTGSPGNGDPGSLDHGGHGSLAEGDRFEETTSTADALRDSYNGCLSALEAFR